MRALILARGLGRRMREPEGGAGLEPAQAQAADQGHKALMPVAVQDVTGREIARPFLDYVLDALARAGFLDVGVVIGPGPSALRDRYTQDAVPRVVRLSWIVQATPLGTADAVLAAAAWAADHSFIVVNGDNLYPASALRALRRLDGPGLAAFECESLVRAGGIAAERVAAFALVRTDAAGYLTKIIEKPGPAALAGAGPRALVSMNCWRFDSRILDACRDVGLSPRGERELPMAVTLAMTRGVRFRTVPIEGEVIDLSRRGDVVPASRRLAGRTPRF